MRVLHVLEPTIGGVPAYVDTLGRCLSDMEVDQVVLTADRDGFENWRYEQWADTVHRVRWRRRSADTLRLTGRIRGIVDRHGIDLIHAHSTFAGIASRWRRPPVPVAYQPHNWGFASTNSSLGPHLVRLVEKQLSSATAMTLLLSEIEEREAPGSGPTRRVNPMVELAPLGPAVGPDRARLRASLGWSEGERVHLCVGELSRRKNQLELVRSWRRQAGDGHRLVLVGDGAEREAIETELRSLDREGNRAAVDLLGWRDDVPRLLSACDTMVIASRGEGFALVIVEALVSGLPVFSTEVGGVEVLRPTDGAVAATVDGVLEAALTTSLCSDREVRADRSGYHRSRFSSTHSATRILDIYREIVARQP